MNCILCTSDKKISSEILEWLIGKKIKILCVLVSKIKKDGSNLRAYCDVNGIRITESDGCNFIEDVKRVDILISFNYGLKIKKWLIDKADIALNFHPAPLPEYRGTGVTAWGMMNSERYWGVTCHFLNEAFDSGDVIEVDYFEIDRKAIKTGYDLSVYSWEKSKEQFIRVLEMIKNGKSLTGVKQTSGHYYSLNDVGVRTPI